MSKINNVAFFKPNNPILKKLQEKFLVFLVESYIFSDWYEKKNRIWKRT